MSPAIESSVLELKSGLKLEKIYEAFTDNEGTEENDRVYVVVRKN